MSDNKPFFTAKQFFKWNHEILPIPGSYDSWDILANEANKLVAPLVESLAQGKQLHEADEREIRRLAEENARIKEQAERAIDAIAASAEKKIHDLQALNATYRETLEGAPHCEYCEYWNECTCFKKALAKGEK